MTINPRWKSGKRRKYQQRFRALGLPCAICGKPIDYSLPFQDPMAFVIDEKIPIKYYAQAGYASKAAAADDFENLQPAHRRCNALKGAKIGFKYQQQQPKKKNNFFRKIPLDGEW